MSAAASFGQGAARSPGSPHFFARVIKAVLISSGQAHLEVAGDDLKRRGAAALPECVGRPSAWGHRPGPARDHGCTRTKSPLFSAKVWRKVRRGGCNALSAGGCPVGERRLPIEEGRHHPSAELPPLHFPRDVIGRVTAEVGPNTVEPGRSFGRSRPPLGGGAMCPLFGGRFRAVTRSAAAFGIREGSRRLGRRERRSAQGFRSVGRRS
jgi:hypothetical protein